jgi:hypothetical protein
MCFLLLMGIQSTIREARHRRCGKGYAARAAASHTADLHGHHRVDGQVGIITTSA